MDVTFTGSAIIVEQETARGSGRFVAQDRMRVARIDLGSDERISAATLHVRLDDSFDGLAARELLHPDLRIVIRAAETETTAERILFDGYPAVQTWKRAASAEEYTLDLQSVYARLVHDPRAQIVGRRMRTGAILDGLEHDFAAFAGRSELVESLPCVFNAGGVGNRAALPLHFVDREGCARQICVFTYDGDPAGVRWSLLDALRYLVWLHHLPEGPVSVSEFLDATECAAGFDPDDRRDLVPPNALVDRLLRAAENLSCEAAHLVEAVARAAAAARVHATCAPRGQAGVCQSYLHLWAAPDGAVRALPMAWGGRHADGVPRYDTSPATAQDVFRANQLQRAALEWNDGGIVNAPVVVGGVRQWEMTVPLVPGWRPEPGLDNVAPPDRQAAREAALTPDMVDFLGEEAQLVPWYRKYHRDGAEFADHRNVGRLWVLNEDGAFDPPTYNRNAPFNAYAPFDFAAVADAAKPAGKWTRRPRPMSRPLARDADGDSRPVLVEVSFDAGASWHAVTGTVQVLQDRAAIWLGATNLTSIIPPGGDWYDTNLWYALVDQVFRVRATAVFPDDARLIVRRRPDALHTPVGFSRTRMIYKPNQYPFASRRQTVNALYIREPDAGGELDASSAAEGAAEALALAEQAGVVTADVTIPWLDDEFEIGTRVPGIGGRNLAMNSALQSAVTAPPSWSVLGKTYRFDADGPGPVVATSLTLVRDVEEG
jgi:hypothetical protein